MILVRLDPHQRATALMSLPRDLVVDIPGHGLRLVVIDKLRSYETAHRVMMPVRDTREFRSSSLVPR